MTSATSHLLGRLLLIPSHAASSSDISPTQKESFQSGGKNITVPWPVSWSSPHTWYTVWEGNNPAL